MRLLDIEKETYAHLLIPAPRRVCAPLLLISLTASLLLATPHARAGTYDWQTKDANGNSTAQSPTYSGGTINDTSTTTNTHIIGEMYGLNTQASPPTYGGNGGDLCYPDASDKATTYTVSAGGSLSAKFTWQPAFTGDLPPSAVIIQENSSVTMGWSYSNGATITGTSSTGFGQSYTIGGSSGNDNIAGVNYSGASGGGSVSAPACSPSVSQSGNSGTSMSAPTEANFTVAYTATASPVTINLGGAIKDSSGNYNILVGQGCSASISGLPSFSQASGGKITYAWSVSGTTFQSWKVVADSSTQSHTAEVDPLPATNSTASWYWNDLKQTTETVSCTATVTPPAGQGAAFPITVTQKVTVYVPGFTFTATPGYMQINTNCPNQNGALCFYAGASPGQNGGINWTATSTTPSMFGHGTVELIQIVTPNMSYTAYTGTTTQGATHPDPQNGHTGLDGQSPYPGSPENEAATPPVAFNSNDSPYATLSKAIGSITMTHKFTDYLMYQAPGSSQVVPLATLTWSTNGSATVPTTDNWVDYVKQHGSDSAGTVTATASTAGNTFPIWTLVNGPISISSF